jgi:hypothetical protein
MPVLLTRKMSCFVSCVSDSTRHIHMQMSQSAISVSFELRRLGNKGYLYLHRVVAINLKLHHDVETYGVIEV